MPLNLYPLNAKKKMEEVLAEQQGCSRDDGMDLNVTQGASSTLQLFLGLGLRWIDSRTVQISSAGAYPIFQKS